MIILHRNLYWILFLALVALCAVGYTAYALYYLYQYDRLDRSVNPSSIQWSTFKAAEDAFVPQARYTFTFEGKTYQGETRWQEAYLNPWAAEEAIDRLKQETLPVWLDSSSPSISTLQKEFPLKMCLYAFMLWALFVYLLFLDRYTMGFKF